MSPNVEELEEEEAEEVVAGVAVAAVVVRGEVVAVANPRVVATVEVVGKVVAAAATEEVKVVAVNGVRYGSLKVLEEVNILGEVANLHTKPRTILVRQAILSSNGRQRYRKE